MNRIFVTGPSWSGKSTTAALIAQVLNLPVVSLDEHDAWKKHLKDKDPCYYIGKRQDPLSPEARAYDAVRHEIVVTTLTAVKWPCVIEGSQLLAVPDVLPAGHTIILCPPRDVVVRNRITRDSWKRIWRSNDPRDHVPFASEEDLETRERIAGMLYDEAAAEVDRVVDLCGFSVVRDLGDVPEAVRKLVRTYTKGQ